MKTKRVFRLQVLIACGLLFIQFQGEAQTVPAGSRKLPETEIKSLLTPAVIQANGILFPVYAVFEFKDKQKTQYLVLAEHAYGKENNNPQNDSVQALIMNTQDGLLKKQMEIRDQIIPHKEIKGYTDHSVWFWTKYISLSDLDGDGMADPVIVYGTAGDNGTEDGKIKMITCYKGKKFVIRQQNHTLDGDRNTNVEAAWYTLPVKIQIKVKAIMKKIMDDGNGIFPAGWEKAMTAKKTYFDEN